MLQEVNEFLGDIKANAPSDPDGMFEALVPVFSVCI